MREASENTKCLVKSQIKIGTPLQGARGRGRVSGRKEETPMWSGAGDGNPRGKRKAQEGGPGQDGNRAERESPQERRKEF